MTSPTMSTSAVPSRSSLRLIHLVAGIAIAIHVYLDPDATALEWVVKAGAIPVVAFSGLALWFYGKLRAALRNRNNSTKEATS